MKNLVKSLSVVAITVLFSLVLEASVYIPGLAQAQFSGSASVNTSTDILSANNLTYASGPVMANTSSSANDLRGVSYSWGNNRDFGYLGKMYMKGGVTYTFAKSIDDWTYFKIEETVLISNSSHDTILTTQYTPEKTGWYDVEIRMGNGGGGCGLANGARSGLAYNTVGNTSVDDFKSLSNGWSPLLDTGDASLFRFGIDRVNNILSTSATMNGDNVDFSVEVTNLTENGGAIIVLYGTKNGGEILSDWEHSITYEMKENGSISGSVPIAEASYIAFCVKGNASSTTYPWVQWTVPVSLTAAIPEFALSTTSVGYGDISYNLDVLGIGVGAESVSAIFQLSKKEDFSELCFEKKLSISSFGSEAIIADGLDPSTDYYARVVGKNNLEMDSISNIVGPDTTLTVTASKVSFEISSINWNTISAYWTVEYYGDGSEDTSLYLEVSNDPTFPVDTILISEPVNASEALPSGGFISVLGLSGSTKYFVRLRSVNSWDIETITEAQEFITAARPFDITSLSATYSSISTATVSAKLTYLSDGLTAKAVMYDGDKVIATFDAITMAAPEISVNVSLNDGKIHEITLVVSVVDAGETFTQTVKNSVVKGNASNYDLATASELNLKVIFVGDTVSFPEVSGKSYFVNGDGIVQMNEDNQSFIAVNPGVCFLEERNEFEGTKNRYEFIVSHKTNGDVFFAEITSTYNWNTAPWKKITNKTEREFPSAADDVAIVYYTSTWKALRITAEGTTVGAIIIRNGGNWNCIQGATDANAVLTLKRTDGERPFILIDNPKGGGQYALGSGNGANIRNQLTIKNDEEGWDFIFGGPHTRNSKYYNNINNTLPVYIEGLRLLIPSGQTFRIIDKSEFQYNNSDPSRYSFGFEYGAANVTTYNRMTTCGFAVEGSGVIELDASRDDFSFALRYTDFTGTFRKTGWNRYYRADSNSIVNGSIPFAPNVSYEVVGAVSKGDDLCEADPAAVSTNRSTSFILNANITKSLPMYENPPENFFACKSFRLYGGWVRLPRNDTNLGVQDPYGLRFDDFRLRGQGYITKLQNYDSTRSYFKNIEIAKFTRETDRDSLFVNGANVNNRIDFNRYGVYVFPALEDYLVGTPDSESEDSGVFQIVPWMVLGENDNGGDGKDVATTDSWVWQLRFATVTNGIVARCTNLSKDVNSAVAAANVVSSKFTLSKDVTVNSLVMENSGHSYLKGHTLTISSGALALTKGGDDCRFDVGSKDSVVGTIVLGDKTHPGYLHATNQKPAKEGQHMMWSKLVAPGGLVKCLAGRLFIFGDQTGVADDLYVNGGTLWLGSPSWGIWGQSDIYDWKTFGKNHNSIEVGCTMTSVTNFTVRGGAVLGLAREGSRLWNEDRTAMSEEVYPVISSVSNITLEDAGCAPARLALGTTYDASAAGSFTCGKVYINGKSIPRGTWGTSESGAENIDDVHFYGPGVLNVLRDDLRSATIVIIK